MSFFFCFLFFFVNTWYAELSSQAFFTSGFAGTLATQPWFTIRDVQTDSWKHGSNRGPRDPHIAYNMDARATFWEHQNVRCVAEQLFLICLLCFRAELFRSMDGITRPRYKHVDTRDKCHLQLTFKTVESRWVLRIPKRLSDLSLSHPLPSLPTCQTKTN